jgi:hypothetical protein
MKHKPDSIRTEATLSVLIFDRCRYCAAYGDVVLQV